MISQMLYKERGGIRIGHSFLLGVNATWPLAKIEVYKDKIILDYLFFYRRIFKKNEITLQKTGGIFSKGIRIIHYNPNVSPFVLFWSFSIDKLCSILRSAGYKIN